MIQHQVEFSSDSKRSTALSLAASGYHVWLGVRNVDDAQALLYQIRETGGMADVVALDVTNPQDIKDAAWEIGRHHEKLDILINNAGVMLDGGWLVNTSITVDPEVLKTTFETNFFGVVALTQALWPLLQAAGNANVVNVSSGMASNTVHANPEGPLKGCKPFAYDASKAALNTFTTHLAEIGQPLGIQVNSAHPGWVRTDLGTEYAELSIEEGIQTILELASLEPNTRTGRFEHAGHPVPW
ncbi:SDR family NAD(P)-dependent oxidoreductase [Pseudomonas savastanoi]|nr:SDR family NAD(P)-dependent oxidoreductase [Pseudomonas savastanoi]